jgi:hypothetical protein
LNPQAWYAYSPTAEARWFLRLHLGVVEFDVLYFSVLQGDVHALFVLRAGVLPIENISMSIDCRAISKSITNAPDNKSAKSMKTGI